MKPLSLTIENFRSYRTHAPIVFKDSMLVAIVGATGAGKSTLLDAIVYALYGTTIDSALNLEHLIAPYQRAMSVDLEFSADGQIYRIARLSRRTGQGTQRLTLPDGSVITGARPVLDAVQGILGLSYETFLQTVLLPQGRFADFLMAKPRERDKAYQDLFGLDILGRIQSETVNELGRAEQIRTFTQCSGRALLLRLVRHWRAVLRVLQWRFRFVCELLPVSEIAACGCSGRLRVTFVRVVHWQVCRPDRSVRVFSRAGRRSRVVAVPRAHGVLRPVPLRREFPGVPFRGLRAPDRDRREVDCGRLSATFDIHDITTNSILPPASLSGGEKFLASLALSLAVVDQAALGGAKIDSLFLDEGFGTLDADCLEKAMTELRARTKTGRTIWIITHLRDAAAYAHQTYLVEKTADGSSVSVVDGFAENPPDTAGLLEAFN